MLTNQNLSKMNKRLFKKQKGKCAHCNNPFALDDKLHTHHILPKAFGGDDSYSNLQLLHAECHRELHSKIGYTLSKMNINHDQLSHNQ